MSVKNSIKEAKKMASMRKAFETVKERQKKNMPPDFDERKARLRKMKEFSVGNDELFKKAVLNLRQNGIEVKIASTRIEALKFIVQEVEGERIIVKSKSKTLNELNLLHELEAVGVNVIETDIGDRIIQISGEKPSHPTGPASHLDRVEIGHILSNFLGVHVNPEPAELIDRIVSEVSEKISLSRVGITGANAITAEEGSIVLIHNEGNITEVMMRPSKHIVVAGAEKIVPNLEEALNMIKIQTYCSTGSLITSQINIISGPSKSADIEKKLFKGIHGPKKIILVLIATNYSMKGEDYKELLYCIGCGSCLLECPLYSVIGSKFGSEHGLGIRGALISAAEGGNRLLKNCIYDCLKCGKCRENCPLSIDFPGFVEKFRIENPAFSSIPTLNRAAASSCSRIRWLHKEIRFRTFEALSKMYKNPG